MKKVMLLILGLLSICFAGTVEALELDGVELLSGSFATDIMTHSNDWEIQPAQEDYKGIPMLVAFNFDADPLLSRIGLKTSGAAKLVVEPFITLITKPCTDYEFGSNFLIKYLFPITKTIQPYFKGGVGLTYMGLDTHEQSTRFNFTPQYGGGIHYFLNEKLALNFEFRRRHLSNAGIKKPNSGIDADMYLGGISFFFE